MAMAVTELLAWLRESGAKTVAIDDGGLILVDLHSDEYIEIGGVPEDYVQTDANALFGPYSRRVVKQQEGSPDDATKAAKHGDVSKPPLNPLPDNLTCPHCGNDRLLYVEDISCARDVIERREGGTLVVDGLYRTSGFDEGATNQRIQCSNCCHEFDSPPDDDIEFS